MKSFDLKYKAYGERSILIEWPNKIDDKILKDLIGFKKAINSNNIEEIVEINYGYNSLLITYSLTINNFYDAFKALESIYSSKKAVNQEARTLWKIPVCYDDEFGIDMTVFSNKKTLSREEIIRLHSSEIYTVHFIGFLPGFLYLGGLNEALHLPRKKTPDLNIKKGAVAIGGRQTGIYPQDSPGGWYVIGSSPIDFFDVTQEVPCFATVGDKLQFVPIDSAMYHSIKADIAAGRCQIENERLHD